MTSQKVHRVGDLFKSATYGDVDSLTEAVKHGVSIMSVTVGGSSVLHFAAFGGQARMVSHLLKIYPECVELGHTLDMQGYDALHTCCAFSGSIDVFQELVRAGFDRNTKTSGGLSALDLAEKFEKYDLVEYIRASESDLPFVETLSLQGGAAVDDGVICEDRSDESRLTITSNEPDDIDDNEWRRFTVIDLLSSAETGDVDRLDKIIHSGVGVTTITKGGSSVLHYAACSGQGDMVSHLVKQYPSCLDKGQQFDNKGYNALHYASRLGMTDMFDQLVSVGFDWEKTTADGRSVLDIAREAKQTDMMHHLERTDHSYLHVRTPSDGQVMSDAGFQSHENDSARTSLKTVSCIHVRTPYRADGRSMTDSGFKSMEDPRDGASSVSDHTMTDSSDKDVFVGDYAKEDSRGPRFSPEDNFKQWISLHRSAAEGNSLNVLNMIENGADANKKINSVFFPNIHLEQKEMLTPMEVAFYSRQNEMVGLLVRYTDDEIVMKCLSKCEGIYLEIKPSIVKGILWKKYKDKCIDIVFGELHPERLKMFVIYTKTIIHGSGTTESGYRVLFRDPTVSSDEGRKVLRHSHEKDYVLSDADRRLVAKVIKQHSDTLWNDHSNLHGIMSSPVKSVGGNFMKQTCLVLLCHFKGFVPDKERLFPRELNVDNDVLPVDVREGHVALHHVMYPNALHTPLSFGCNIGSAEDNTTRYGTVGPFVKLNDGKIGFITCAHVVHDNCRFVGDSLPDITVLQPSNGDTSIAEEDRVCGKVVNIKYRLDGDTSIDVAVVEITVTERMPSSPGFAAFNQEQLSVRGIPGNTPLFDHGEYGEPTVGKEVIKFGSASGVTYGTYRGVETFEFSPKLYGRPSEVERWRGVYYIENQQCKEKDCQLPPFSSHGDSGAGVFQVKDDNSNSLICVGILVGADTATGSGIVIPIKPILDEFGLTLKVFQPHE